jgi:hypothetical protein
LTYASPHAAIFLGIHTLDGHGWKIAHFFYIYLAKKDWLRPQLLSQTHFEPAIQARQAGTFLIRPFPSSQHLLCSILPSKGQPEFLCPS